MFRRILRLLVLPFRLEWEYDGEKMFVPTNRDRGKRAVRYMGWVTLIVLCASLSPLPFGMYSPFLLFLLQPACIGLVVLFKVVLRMHFKLAEEEAKALNESISRHLSDYGSEARQLIKGEVAREFMRVFKNYRKAGLGEFPPSPNVRMVSLRRSINAILGRVAAGAQVINDASKDDTY